MEHIVSGGGAGFIGSYLSEALVKSGHHVTIIDDLSSGKLEYIQSLLSNPQVTFIRDSVQNISSLTDHCSGACWIFGVTRFRMG